MASLGIGKKSEWLVDTWMLRYIRTKFVASALCWGTNADDPCLQAVHKHAQYAYASHLKCVCIVPGAAYCFAHLHFKMQQVHSKSTEQPLQMWIQWHHKQYKSSSRPSCLYNESTSAWQKLAVGQENFGGSRWHNAFIIHGLNMAGAVIKRVLMRRLTISWP